MEQRKENVMGTKPIRSLLPGMAFPIMLSMLVQALYNVVDSIFVAMLSENALASVNLVFPVQNLMVAVAVGTATGINALLSRRLGQKDRAGAEKVAENGVFITLATWLVFAAAGAVGSGWFLGLFTSVPEIAAGGEVYMRIVTVLGGGCFLQITFERILQSTGKTVYQMASQMAGAVINIILDPIMIFGLLGAALLGADQWVKAWVVGHLQMGETTSLFPGFLELMRVHNYGAAWSSFAGQKWLLLGVTGVILAMVLWVLARRIVRHPLGICACCLILSGGIGNIIDRLRLGYVVDMLHFQFWPSYPTFNVADVCIVSGAILGAIYYVLLYEKHDRRKTDGASDPANGQ